MINNAQTLERTGIRLLLVALATIILLAVFLAIDVVLLSFLGLLFAVFLVKTSTLLGKYLPLAYGWNLAIVLTTLILLSIGILFLFGVSIESRMDGVSKKLDESTEEMKQWLAEHPAAKKSVDSIPFLGKLTKDIEVTDQNGKATEQDNREVNSIQQSKPKSDSADQESNDSNRKSTTVTRKEEDDEDASPAGLSDAPVQAGDRESEELDTGKDTEQENAAQASSASKLAGQAFQIAGSILKTTFGLVTNLAVVFFIGVFIAVDPTLYQDGFAKLFAPQQRPRVVEVMNNMGDSLFNWLNGRFIAMLITGLGTGIALWVLGVSLAFTIGTITGILTFIPNIGAIVSLLLAVMMALPQGPTIVISVVVVYGILQLIESNVITPLVQQHQTSIPPALLIAFQVFMGVLVGFLGILVSTPLLAATIVLVKEVWVKDVLEDSIQEESTDDDDDADN